jgi:hypothetical protein
MLDDTVCVALPNYAMFHCAASTSEMNESRPLRKSTAGSILPKPPSCAQEYTRSHCPQPKRCYPHPRSAQAHHRGSRQPGTGSCVLQREPLNPRRLPSNHGVHPPILLIPQIPTRPTPRARTRRRQRREKSNAPLSLTAVAVPNGR